MIYSVFEYFIGVKDGNVTCAWVTFCRNRITKQFSRNRKGAGELLNKIVFSELDANNLIENGTFMQNLYNINVLNWPTKNTFALIEIFRSYSSANHYILQRVSTFDGLIYIRNKYSGTDWTAWRKVGTV